MWSENNNKHIGNGYLKRGEKVKEAVASMKGVFNNEEKKLQKSMLRTYT